MTFVKFSEENFVNTKITNRFKVNYKNSDNTTFLYDNNIDSKSIIYNQSNTHGTFENSILGLQENNNLNEKISSFFNFANTKIDYKVESELELKNKNNNYFINKDSLSSLFGVTNENLKQFNFKNSFSINRTVNTFLPCSFELYKFNTTKINLYDYYNNDFSKDFYPELNYGFCNYNTVNFFSQKYNSNKLHSNCLVYSNQKDSQNNNDVEVSKDFSVNLWVNIRNNKSTNRGCIMHIPDVFSLYSIEDLESFRICITTGSDSKKLLNSQNFQSVNFENTSAQSNDSICISSNEHFEYNSWYNLTINFFNTSDNKYSILIYKNGDLIESFNLNINREKLEKFNSFICIGNKPDYFVENLAQYNTDYEDVFYSFFGKNYASDDLATFDGPFYTKDINLGSNTSYNDTKFISDIINNDKMIYFNDSIEGSSSFHGEIQEIKIYSDTLSNEKIINLFSNSVSDVSTEMSVYSLSFYVPVYYLPLSVKKVGLFNCSLNSTNLYYNSIYNPYFANSSLGRDISVENYLVEFVKSKKPNVVISGFDNKNIFGNYYESNHKQFINNTNDFQKIKKGVGSEEIFLENLEALSTDDLKKYNNISYRNLLIFPNDNGIPDVSFESIDYFLLNDNVFDKNSNFFNNDNQKKLYHVDCYNTLKYVQYQENDRLLVNREGVSGRKIKLNINNKESNILSTKDTFFDISNYLYHDETINNLQDFVTENDNIDTNILKYLDNFNSTFIETKSNPINRDYISNNIVFRSNDVILSEDLNYRFLPLPYYNINKSDISLFSQIIDISTQYYNKKIIKGTINLKDENILGTNGISLNISDNKKGFLFRNDCQTKVADWNYLGHVFYKDGICLIHHTSLYSFGKSDFSLEFTTEGNMYVHETNIPISKGKLNVSNNTTYNKDFRLDESAFNSDEPFVFITDVNIHDENLNIVAKAKMAHPIPKKNTDNLLIRLKMDY